MGCCGAAKESRCLLGMFTGFLFLLIVGQITIGALAWRYGADGSVTNWIEQEAGHLWTEASAETQQEIQNALKCCGFDSSQPGTNCPSDATGTCESAIESWIKSSLKNLEIAGIVLGAVELLGLLFGCCLFHAIPSGEEEKRRLLEEARALNRQVYH